jgi:hypothetical protein
MEVVEFSCHSWSKVKEENKSKIGKEGEGTHRSWVNKENIHESRFVFLRHKESNAQPL